MEEIKARCFKCRSDVGIKNVEIHQTPNGRNLAKGLCQACGGKAGRFVPLKKDAPKIEPTSAPTS
jgi:hypothetical protein